MSARPIAVGADRVEQVQNSEAVDLHNLLDAVPRASQRTERRQVVHLRRLTRGDGGHDVILVPNAALQEPDRRDTRAQEMGPLQGRADEGPHVVTVFVSEPIGEQAVILTRSSGYRQSVVACPHGLPKAV